MKLLLGTFLLAGVCWLGAAMRFTTMANFDKKKVAGNWYPLAIILTEKNFPLHTLKATPRGLSYSFKYLDNGKCKKRKIPFNEYKGPGNFNITSRWRGPSFLHPTSCPPPQEASVLRPWRIGPGAGGFSRDRDFKQPLFCAEGPNLYQILDTDYKTYIVSYVVRPIDSYLLLVGKEQSLSSDLEKKFKEVASSVGDTGDVVPVTRLETC